MKSEVFNMDCVEAMKGYPDNYFELAIVDPPYGLGKRTTDGGTKRNTQTKFMQDIRRTNWDDNVPTDDYWKELFRVSKNQIVWGGNYFGLPAHRCFIVWDKMTYVPTMSQVEQAWTSFDSPARLKKINSNNPKRLHPTQKPVALYRWLLQNYAKPGDKILDTHLGSGSSRIAADMEGYNFTGYELDKDYFEASVKRFNDYKQQIKLL
jgi:site-specific DNA-methyltransferase (adenine-specific)